jgi:hypothetical protein
MDLEVMMDLFGAFLLVLIGIELLDTIKIMIIFFMLNLYSKNQASS